jgi:hypothetical protein
VPVVLVVSLQRSMTLWAMAFTRWWPKRCPQARLPRWTGC